MLADLDYFFAQCEELRNPKLKTKPVVVGVYSGRIEDSGAVSTANLLVLPTILQDNLVLIQEFHCV